MIGLESQAARKADTILFLYFTEIQTQLAFFALVFRQSQLHLSGIKMEGISHSSYHSCYCDEHDYASTELI